MFARSVGWDGRLTVSEASPPHAKDRAGRTWLELDHARCLAEIEERYARGLHFIGYWHTHAEPHPAMSQRDVEVLHKNIREGGILLERILSVVVGTALDANGLCLATVGASSPTHATLEILSVGRESAQNSS